jgi:hypothetical protein
MSRRNSVRDLMSQPARAAMDGDEDVLLGDAEILRHSRIEDLGHRLHLEVVIA